MMVIIQKPNHVLRWYGMVVGLIACAATIWAMHEFFDLYGLGVVLGVMLFFVVWGALVVIHAPFAVKLGIDEDQQKILVESHEFTFQDLLSVDISNRVQRQGEAVQISHELRIAGYTNPVQIHLASTKPEMNRAQLQTYEKLLAQADLGPRNPVIQREHHRDPQRYGPGAEQQHPLEDEIGRAKALAQLRELLADTDFNGGLAGPESQVLDDQRVKALVHDEYRANFPEFFGGGAPDTQYPAMQRPAKDADMDYHRSVVRDLGSQIEQRTAGLGRGRRVFAWVLGVALLLILLTVIVSMTETLTGPYEVAVNATMITALLITLIAAVVHSALFDLHIRAIRREADEMIIPGSTVAQSIAVLTQQWWLLHEEDKRPEWSTTAQHEDPRHPEWNPDELVLESGTLPENLSHAWVQNPRRTLVAAAITLGLAAMFMLFMGIDTQDWGWYIGTGLLALAAIGALIRSDRNKAHKRHDLREFAHKLERLRQTGGLQQG